jgi:uncharacterized protein YkwD
MSARSRALARPLVRLLAAGLMITVLASCLPMNSSETQLFVATNDLRKSAGLPALNQQDALMDEARSWAASMAAAGQLSHSDPSTWGIGWTAVAENVGVAGSIETVISLLESSPEHRDHMLSTKYTDMAVGTARGKDGRIYAVQLFWHG